MRASRSQVDEAEVRKQASEYLRLEGVFTFVNVTGWILVVVAFAALTILMAILIAIAATLPT